MKKSIANFTTLGTMLVYKRNNLNMKQSKLRSFMTFGSMSCGDWILLMFLVVASSRQYLEGVSPFFMLPCCRSVLD
jgi:hypothetical protein